MLDLVILMPNLVILVLNLVTIMPNLAILLAVVLKFKKILNFFFSNFKKLLDMPLHAIEMLLGAIEMLLLRASRCLGGNREAKLNHLCLIHLCLYAPRGQRWLIEMLFYAIEISK